MKLLFVHDATFWQSPDGRFWGTSVNNRTLERYHRIAHDVSVAIRIEPISEDADYSKYTEIDSIYNIVPIPNLMSIKGLTVGFLKIRRKLSDEVRRYDCVVTRLSGLVGVEAANVCCNLSVPYIVECVGNPNDSLRLHGNKGRMLAPFFAGKVSKAIKQADYVIYVTDEYLQKVFPTHGRWVACSNVTLPENAFSRDLDRSYRSFCDKSNSFRYVLGSAGKIDMQYKGYQYVVQALSELKKSGINAVYQLAGNGDNRYLLEQAKKYGVEDRVEFLGSMTNEAVLDWMSTLDLYLQPSDTEGLPRALIEAMSVGCPCVGSDAGGIPELIDKESIFSRGCVSELVSAIFRVMATPDVFAKRNYQKSQQYSLKAITDKRNAFFDLFVNEELSK